MTPPNTDLAALQAAVLTIWQECGETPPAGEELRHAAGALRSALNSGRQIPRLVDKTIQPMSGRRPDIEEHDVPAT